MENPDPDSYVTVRYLDHRLDDVTHTVRSDIAAATGELRSEMAATTAELRSEMAANTAELRAEMVANTAELRDEMHRQGKILLEHMTELIRPVIDEMRAHAADDSRHVKRRRAQRS